MYCNISLELGNDHQRVSTNVNIVLTHFKRIERYPRYLLFPEHFDLAWHDCVNEVGWVIMGRCEVIDERSCGDVK